MTGFQFLSDLEKKLRPIGLKDRENLLAIKKDEPAEKGYPFDGEFYIWDYRYYDRKFIEKSLDLDDSLVKEYFPVTVVVPAILDIYQRLLSVRFVALETETWHPGVYLKVRRRRHVTKRLFTDVRAYSVWKADAKDESGFVGYTYLDLYPRGMSPFTCRMQLMVRYRGPIQNQSTRMPPFGLLFLGSRSLMQHGTIQ